jgi:hypothetical protein
MKEIRAEHTLCLTEEEAMGLLDIVMVSPVDLTFDQRTAIVKLSEFCREMLRESAQANAVASSVALVGAGSAFAV